MLPPKFIYGLTVSYIFALYNIRTYETQILLFPDNCYSPYYK
jgi:hypothetical protein